jgi:V/A-type H+-transporting ATPase subunit K
MMQRWIKMVMRLNVVLGIGALVLLTSAPLVFVGEAMAQETGDAALSGGAAHTVSAPDMPPTDAAKVRCWAFLAAAIATGIGSLAAGYAVGHVGTAAMGAIAEKPELMGKSLIYVALAEGIAIYGLLISIIVLSKV